MFATQAASLVVLCVPLGLFHPHFEWPQTSTAPDLKDDGSKDRTEDAKFDFLGAFLCIVAFLPPFIALSLGGEVLPWRHPLILTLFGLSLPAITVFVLWELCTTCEPIVQVRLVFGAKLSRPFVCLLLFMLAHNSVSTQKCLDWSRSLVNPRSYSCSPCMCK